MDDKQGDKGIIVGYGEIFLNKFNNFLIKDQDKILDFSKHIENNGFNFLPGRNKASHHVSTDDSNFSEKVKHAQKHNLHHYHIGIPSYDETNEYGDWTSEWIIHYQHLGNEIHIVELDYHPPFTLPPKKHLK